MLKLHVFNLPEQKNIELSELNSIFLKRKEEPLLNYNIPYYVVEIINSTKIFAYIDFLEEKEYLEHIIQKIGITPYKLQEIKQNISFVNNLVLTNIDIKDDTPSLACNKNGVRFAFNFFIGDTTSKEFKSFFSLDYPIIIKSHPDEEVIKLGSNKNLFFRKEIDHLIFNLNIPYGIAFDLIKNKKQFLESLMEAQNISTITNENINIQNNSNSLFVEKKIEWHCNKQLHILNLSNVENDDLTNCTFWKNKSNVYYILLQNEYHKLKTMFVLNRKNLVQANRIYNNKASEIVTILEDKTLNCQWMMKSTKSINKMLAESLTKIEFEIFKKEYLNIIEKNLEETLK
jgi:hypothetical protein